jgi:hypothetical protein
VGGRFAVMRSTNVDPDVSQLATRSATSLIRAETGRPSNEIGLLACPGSTMISNGSERASCSSRRNKQSPGAGLARPVMPINHRLEAYNRTTTHTNKWSRELCRNCVNWGRSRRRIPASTESHQGASRRRNSLNPLRNEMFQCRLVSLAEVAFQACSFSVPTLSCGAE